MAEKTKKSFFETRLMRSKIKSSSVSLFPEAGLGYLLGPILALVGNSIINIWLVQYWQTVLGFESWNQLFGTLLPIISSIIIIAGNILVGRLMERKPTLAGKARPLILIGMPVILVAMLVLFNPFMYPEAANEAEAAKSALGLNASTNGAVLTSILVAVGYNLYYAFAWPLYYTSHSALVNLSTRDGGKRGLLGTAIMAAQLAAAGVSGMAGGILVDLLGLFPKYEYTPLYLAAHPELGDVKFTNSYAEVLKNGLVEGVDFNTTITRQQANEKWMIVMIIMIIALIVGCILEYFFTRERITEEQIKNAEAEANGNNNQANKVTMSQQIKICMKDKFWWMLMIFWFLYQFGGMMKNNAMSFFSQALTGGAAVSSVINTVGAIPTAVGMVLVWPLAAKFTKSKTIAMGGIVAAVAAAASFACLAVPGNVGAITGISVASFCIKALGTAPAMYISMALMANVLDHQEAVHGVRTDGFTMAVYGSIMVAMSGICNGIIAGFNNIFQAGDARKIVNTFLAFGVEGICYLIIAIMFIFMKVEKFTNADNKAIIADQKAAVLAAGGTWVEPEERARLEDEENARLVEEARVNELKAKCEAKGLDFEAENNAYLAKKAEADQKAADKKAAAEAKKQAKLDAMSEEEKAKAAKAKEEADAKQAELDAQALAELNEIRKANNREAVA
ncbi:MAG: MFS transporter [Bacilli bacterium]|nr:MFS transporter [Bacilli bacterium]